MKAWIWRLIQTAVLSGYVATQFLMYTNMSSRINNALLRIENLERFLSLRENAESVVDRPSSFKEKSVREKKQTVNGEHEHVRLKRTVANSNIDITALFRRLQIVEVSVLNSTSWPRRQVCLQGSPGNQGLAGRDGLPGQVGEPGRQGPIGIPGRDGRPGSDGRDGMPGRDGKPGRDGQIGPPGVPGSNGATGPRGDTSDRGPPGPPGIKGRRGKKGAIGPRGPPGPPRNMPLGPSSSPLTVTPTDTGQKPHPGGAVYTRWGATECLGRGSSVVYKGRVAGSSLTETGSGSNYVCMPLNPLYARPPSTNTRGALYGVQYGHIDDIFTRVPWLPRNMKYQGVPCAVCRTLSRPSAIMVPARNVCPSKVWTREYHGYLMSSSSNTTKSEYICVDADAKVVQPQTNQRTQWNSLLTAVRGKCGTLPCPPYRQNWDLTCAVCTA